MSHHTLSRELQLKEQFDSPLIHFLANSAKTNTTLIYLFNVKPKSVAA